MTKKPLTLSKPIYIVAVVSMLFSASGLHAEEKLPMSESFTATTKDFLSDPARTGSLVGSILAGAAIANPLAPLLGSVAGFIIGKRSDYSDKDSDAARRQAYANRSFIPDGGAESAEITNLVGLTGGSGEPPLAGAEPIFPEAANEALAPRVSVAAKQVVIVRLPGETEPVNPQNQVNQTVTTGLSDMSEGMSARIALQKQLAYACDNVQLSQPASPSCYYYSQ